jgi:phospholipid/cholesterol/gamma-HCH transport system substrate-binding protein
MSDLTRNFVIGLVSIVALIGFAVLLMFFGELKLLPTRHYEIQVHMNSAGGLRPGSPVELNGVYVGSIREVRLNERPDDPAFPVLAVAEIRERQLIPRAIDTRVDRALLAGSAVLQLIGPPPLDRDPANFLPQDGTGSISVVERSLMEGLRAELDERTKPLMAALDSFNELSETYIALGRNLSDLVRPLKPDEPEYDEQNLRVAIMKFTEVLSDAREAFKLANRWLSDEQLLADAKVAIANAKALTDQASKTIDQYGRLAQKLEGDVDEILKAVLPVADEMAVTLSEVRALLHTAREGRGTIARLLNDPDLYDSLTDAAERLEQTLTDVRLFIQKIRAEGLPTRIW